MRPRQGFIAAHKADDWSRCSCKQRAQEVAADKAASSSDQDGCSLRLAPSRAPGDQARRRLGGNALPPVQGWRQAEYPPKPGSFRRFQHLLPGFVVALESTHHPVTYYYISLRNSIYSRSLSEINTLSNIVGYPSMQNGQDEPIIGCNDRSPGSVLQDGRTRHRDGSEHVEDKHRRGS